MSGLRPEASVRFRPIADIARLVLRLLRSHEAVDFFGQLVNLVGEVKHGLGVELRIVIRHFEGGSERWPASSSKTPTAGNDCEPAPFQLSFFCVQRRHPDQ